MLKKMLQPEYIFGMYLMILLHLLSWCLIYIVGSCMFKLVSLI